jgi:hypothetical protein
MDREHKLLNKSETRFYALLQELLGEREPLRHVWYSYHVSRIS